MQVAVDGRNFPFDAASIRTVSELVELIKASIDPDTIIADIVLQGRDLSASDWQTPLAAHGGATLEVRTSTRKSFLEDRLSAASGLLDRIIAQFAEVTGSLKKGDVRSGNTGLNQAVEDLKAFVQWYSTLLQMLPGTGGAELKQFEGTVGGLLEVCEQMLQQQLYRSWWAVAESIEKRLIPELQQIKSSCLSIFDAQQKGATAAVNNR